MGDQRKRAEHSLELVAAQLIQLRDPRVQAGERFRIVAPREDSSQARRFPGTRPARTRRSGDREPLHHRRGDVGGHAQPHQEVDDEAVEEAAEKSYRARSRKARSKDGVASRRSQRAGSLQSV